MFAFDQILITRRHAKVKAAWHAAWRTTAIADRIVPFEYPPEREGVRTFYGVVAFAWWTDPHARRHWRFVAVGPRGETASAETEARARRRLFDPARPPLWWVYPERLLLRTADGIRTMMAACGCGVCGETTDLAWAGPYCGPCADHYAERAAEGRPPDTPRLARWPVGGRVHSLAWSPDGSRLAVVDASGVSVWDANGRRTWGDLTPRPRPSDAHAAPWHTHAAIFSPDGRLLMEVASARVWVRDANTGADVAVGPQWPSGSTATGIWEPTTSRLVVANGHDDLLMGSPAHLAADRMSPIVHTGSASALGFSPDGSRLLTRWHHLTRMLDARGDQVWVYPSGHGSRVAVSPDGRLVAVDATDSVDILDAANGRPVWVIREHPNNVVDLAFAADSAGLITACRDGRVLTFDIPQRRFVAAWRGHRDDLTAMALSPDGETLATGDTDGVVRLWPWADLHRTRTNPTPRKCHTTSVL